MTKKGSLIHEETLQEEIKKHVREGFRVIDLNGKSPDAIVIDFKNKQIGVIDAMKRKTNWHQKQKKELYLGLGFDTVRIKEY